MMFRFGIAALGLVALAACNDSTNGAAAGGGGGMQAGGGGGGTAASSAVHNQAFAAASGQGATTTMPQTFTGTFNGSIQAQLNDTSSGTATPVGYAVGDLELEANWREGQTGPAFTGTASNFAGEVNGQATSWTGQLEATRTGAFNRIDVIDGATICGAIPAGQPCPVDPNSRTSSVNVDMTGDLQADGGTAGGTSSLGLAGFVTNDNMGVTGAVTSGTTGGFILPDGSTAVVAGQESTFFATQ